MMTRPTGYLIRMLIFLVAVGAAAAALSPVLISAFDNNPILNGLILFILLLGILWNLNQVLRLRPELLDAVNAAAGFALANERSLETVQRMERREHCVDALGCLKEDDVEKKELRGEVACALRRFHRDGLVAVTDGGHELFVGREIFHAGLQQLLVACEGDNRRDGDRGESLDK